TQIVAGAREYQGLDVPIGQRSPFQKVAKVMEGPARDNFMATLHRQALDSRQPDAHGTGLDDASGLGKMDMRPEQPHAVACEIGRYRPKRIEPTIIVEHAAGEWQRMMGLQIGGLPGELRVSGSMGLLEGVGGKA